MEVAAETALVEGTRVGRFVIVRPVGAGGMGTVYEARDPELERSVALKLLRGKSPVLAMRLLREAQVLAQLQHPNVVGVHALDLHDDQVVIAMELVAGETLDKHLARTKPDWRGIVALFVQAGEGLAAAHAKGIVHRDIKPSNIFVDETGRVRVGDFGLARQLADGEEPDETPARKREVIARQTAVTTDGDTPIASGEVAAMPRLAGAPLTHAGTVLGTPFYMSPEQHLGRRVTAASDQFSFCVALWVALYGEHPFAISPNADNPDNIEDAVIAGKRREPASGHRIPRWLERALDRGLAVDPEQRHPSMRALLDVLVSHPARRRRLALAGVGVLFAATGVIVWGVARRTEEPCPVPVAQVGGTWGDARRAQLRERLVVVDQRRAESRFDVATRTVDAFVTRWRDAHVSACKATRVDGEQSDTLLDARMRCLRHRLSELDASLDLVEQAADAGALDNTIGALGKLTPVETCADPNVLAQEIAAPLPPAARARSEELLRRIDETEVKLRATWPADLPAEAAAIAVAARELEHAPTLTAALTTLVRVENAANRKQAAEAGLRELTQVAARARDARSEAYAWTNLVSIIGSSRGKPDEALALVPAASAAVVRAGEPLELRVALLFAEAEVLGVAGKPPEALAKLDQARALLEGPAAKDPQSKLASLLADVWQETGTTNAQSGNYAEAQAAYRKALALMPAVHGPDSLDEALVWNNAAAALVDEGKLEEALEPSAKALRIRELRTGESAYTASSLINFGNIYGYQEKWDKAHEMYTRALRIFRARLAPGDPGLADPVLGYAWVVGGLGRTEEEMAGYDEVIALFDNSKTSKPTLATALINRAETWTTRGKCEVALPDFTRAIGVLETHFGTDSPYLVTPLLGHGRCSMLLRRPADAIAPLERALKLQPIGREEVLALGLRGWLGRALVESGRDPARGATLEREAREALAAAAPTDKSAAKELADLDRPRQR